MDWGRKPGGGGSIERGVARLGITIVKRQVPCVGQDPCVELNPAQIF